MSSEPKISTLSMPETRVHSRKTMASYGSGKFLVEFYSAAFSILLFKFYETNLQLSSILTGLGIVIYSIWNAINDPIVGYFTIRPTRWAKKYGRRFPWIVFGCFIWVFTLLPIFILPKALIEDPVNNQGLIFLWFVIAVMVHDGFFSIWELNYQSLFPDKFRSEKSRSNAAVWATMIGVFGIAIGSLLPGFIVDYDDVASYGVTALVFTAVGIIFFFLLLPGVREDPDMIERYLASIEAQKQQTEPEPGFFVQMKEALTHRNFMAFILFYLLYQACTMSLSASVDYLGDYILPGDKVETTMIFAGMLVGALLAIPLWGKIAVKISNQKALMYAAVVIIFSLILMTFIPDESYWGFTITVTIFGLGFGGYWMLITPVLADSIDEIVVITKKRNDGMYMGMRAFFGRLAFAIQAISFTIVHELTGFDNTADVQSDLAKTGIRIHLSILPMIFMALGLLVFWRMNTLNTEKMEEIRAELKMLNL
ncbi:MAG: MFS transporter [Promethearchaeota archaeon]